MQQSPPLALYARNIGRLIAGFLACGALFVAGGHGQPRPAAAASSLHPPQIVSVRMEKPDTAYVTFRETNDAGADVTSDGLQYIIFWADQGVGLTSNTKSVAAAGNGRVHTVTITGLNSFPPTCFAGYAFIPVAGVNHIDRLFDFQSDNSNSVCADMSSAGMEQSPFPCGVSGIKVTNANTAIREYDYTYYCDGSYRFRVTALFDTRPFSDDPADANKHRGFEMLTDGDTKIIVSWTCSSDPWGLVDTMYCTQRGDADSQNPKASFPVQIGSLPLSVRFLNDEDRQQLASALRQALSAPSGSNPFALAAASAPAAGSAATAPLPQPPAAPANFKAARDNGLGLTIVLTWDAASGADYYYLTAYSHNGNNPVALGHGAPKLDKTMTRFTVASGDNAANVQGGVDFKLQACNAGGCSPTLTVTVS